MSRGLIRENRLIPDDCELVTRESYGSIAGIKSVSINTIRQYGRITTRRVLE